MIAVVKGCRAVFSALLFLILPIARAADDLGGAARELARKTSALGRLDPQTVVWRNVSSLGSAELSQARAAFESALADTRNGSGAPLTARITLSENPTQYLLVEEAQSGEERRVWVAGWKRAAAARNAASGVWLRSRLVWEQDEQILDAAYSGELLLVLSPSKVALSGRGAGESAPLAPAKPWPRDLRGRLRVTADTFQVFLPGMTCAGSVNPSLHMDCRPGDQPWVLESGSRALLLANFGARNFFDGRVVTQSGARRTIAPFFSAAAVEDQGRTLWLAAMVDGRTQIFDPAFEPQGSIPQWGSDIAGIEARCGAATQILATRPGDWSEPDAVQSFALVNGTAAPLAAPIPFGGPITALWPSGPNSATAIARDLSTGKYGAYVITVACGQ